MVLDGREVTTGPAGHDEGIDVDSKLARLRASINLKREFHGNLLEKSGVAGIGNVQRPIACQRALRINSAMSTVAPISSAATKYKPADSVPVDVFNAPIMKGAAKPARLPIELISAIPPAAAVPVRKTEDSDQKTGKAARMPVAPRLRANRASGALPSDSPVRARPTPPSRVAAAQWMRRSPVLSEWMPLAIMPIVPA